MSDGDILSKVEEFMLDDQEFSTDFEQFAAKNCAVFEDTEENKLSYMPIYMEFTNLFNSRVEAFLTKNGSSLEQFVKACESADEDNFAVQMILSITSFEAFKELMVNEKKKMAADAQ